MYNMNLKTNCTSYGASYLTSSHLTERGLIYTSSSSVAATAPTSVPSATSGASSQWVKFQAPSASDVTINLTGLSSNTTYYVYTYAKNAWGTTISSSKKVVKTQLYCGATLTDQDGNTYGTRLVTDGSNKQCWMRSNLKATHYDNIQDFTPSITNDGTAATEKTGTGSSSSTAPYYYRPANNSSNVSTYGRLYNWAAAVGYGVTNYPSGSNMTTSSGKTQGMCPRGWHVPTLTELNTWIIMSSSDQVTNFNPVYAGCYANTMYNSLNEKNFLWTCNSYSTDEGYGGYISNTSGRSTYYVDKYMGYSVRCIQDISY